jgi:nitronate monooxygenase
MTWKQTAATHRLGIDVPIVQGPFGGGLSAVALAATVSNAGGLGSFGAHHLAPEQIGVVTSELRQHTKRPFAINLWVSNEDTATATLTQAEFDRHLERLAPYYHELGAPLPAFPNQFGQKFEAQVEALIEAKPPVFSFVYGLPDAKIIEACRERGIATIATVTTTDEAVAAEDAGVDVIVATGFEAGGHRVSFLHRSEDVLTGLIALVPQIRDKVAIPVIAAGGIADGRGIAAALMLGADAVQIGTAFLACDESGASKAHRDALFSDAARDTVLTRAFTGRLARGIRNRYSDEMSRYVGDFAPYPVQSWLASGFKPAAFAQGRGDLVSLWSGQSAGLLHHHRAGDLLQSLLDETDHAFARHLHTQ